MAEAPHSHETNTPPPAKPPAMPSIPSDILKSLRNRFEDFINPLPKGECRVTPPPATAAPGTPSKRECSI